MVRAEQIFPKMFLTCFSFVSTDKELNLYKAFATEHSFKGIVTDLPSILEYNLCDNQTYCGINFPYMGMSDSVVLYLCKKEKELLSQLGGIITSVNKFDVVNHRWNKIREFFKNLSDKNHYTLISIDVHWLKNTDCLTKFFSLVDPYINLFPVISCHTFIRKTTPKNLLEWSTIAKNSSIKPVAFFGPPPTEPKFLLDLLNSGFATFGLPANLAINFITRI